MGCTSLLPPDRRLLGSAAGSHRKHVASLRSLVSSVGHEGSALPRAAPNAGTLEQGNIQTVPIGYISSCFSVKNGTPRQPTICGPSRATLRVRQSVFNNPEHALLGLEHFSHVWVIFLFHKNGHLSYKAKVKPPRLNGQRVGVYSTRSPHRPNALGLTLAKLDRIEGDTIHLSDIDMIAGTPVLDIKPYIPDYDSPRSRSGADVEPCGSDVEPPEMAPVALDEVTAITQLCENSGTSSSEAHENIHINVGEKAEINGQKGDAVLRSAASNISTHLNTVLREVRAYVDDTDPPEWNGAEKPTRPSDSPESNPPESAQHSSTLCFGASTIAGWVREPPVSSLEVRFTPHAERELERFLPPDHSGAPGDDRPRFNFLRSAGEAMAAIRGVLSADPRSVYRRTRCGDRLFFFTLDTAHITCWFGRGFAEVLRVQPVELEPKKLST